MDGRRFKFLYGQAYRAPNAFERDSSDGASDEGKDETQPRLEDRRPSIRMKWLMNRRLASAPLHCIGVCRTTIKDLITLGDRSGRWLWESIENTDEAMSARGGSGGRMEGAGVDGKAGQAARYEKTEGRNDSQTAEQLAPRTGQSESCHSPSQRAAYGRTGTAGHRGSEDPAGNESGGYWIANLTLLSRKVVRDWEFRPASTIYLIRSYGDPWAAITLRT